MDPTIGLWVARETTLFCSPEELISIAPLKSVSLYHKWFTHPQLVVHRKACYNMCNQAFE